MKILVVTNRNLNVDRTGEKLFGEGVNVKGPGEIRLAWAEHEDGEWQVDLVDEPDDITGEDTMPSRDVFREFKDGLRRSSRNCVFYIHGYNKTFRESLEQAKEFQDIYDLEVVTFSWPANPGGFITNEYRQAQAIARASIVALDRGLEKLSRYIHESRDEPCESSFNLLIHSLGNYMFQHLVMSSIFTGETRIFDNIILQQADVDNRQHKRWVDMLRFSRRQYVTINERDKILNASDIINSDRLGNTVTRLNARRPQYIDFSNAARVGKAHRLYSRIIDNKNAKRFFVRALNGERAEIGSGIRFNEARNAFEVE